MAYPSLDEYNEAFQVTHLTLLDSELKKGTIKKTGLGLPLALCGGFALTYTLETSGKKYAVRVFHKESKALETRYQEISKKIKSLNSQYFVPFDFQKQGIKIKSQLFPVVKMAWASGVTLGEFVESNYTKKASIQNLINSLKDLSVYLEDNNMSHGDIQPGNLMVSNNGSKIQLIDYDGIYVDSIKSIGSSELGHKNFQHPQRTGKCWDHKLDRFSFISVVLALQILVVKPEIWNETQSDGDSFIFKANDFAAPNQSKIFQRLINDSTFTDRINNFIAACLTPFSNIPTLNDFLANKNIPHASKESALGNVIKYISAFPVIDASNYDKCLMHVGDKVEVVGRIFEVNRNTTVNHQPYIFINFGNWKGKIMKITIWSDTLSTLTNIPDNKWKGRWISVTGVIEPPFTNLTFGYTHLAITLIPSTNIHIITENDAKYRLSSTGEPASNVAISKGSYDNKDILDVIKSEGKSPSLNATNTATKVQSSSTTSHNKAILDSMRSSAQNTKQTTQVTNNSVQNNQHPNALTPQDNKDVSAKKNIFVIVFWIIVILIVILKFIN